MEAYYLGTSASACGYCGAAEPAAVSEYIQAERLNAHDCRQFFDNGWRRSGRLFYRPLRAQTCCPPFTIRLAAADFAISRAQRKTLRRFIRHLVLPAGSDQVIGDEMHWLAGYIAAGCRGRLRLVLEAATFDHAAFELYREYQASRHGDRPEDLSPAQYTRFLVDSPIVPAGRAGTHHYRWFCDDRLVAVGVLDMLEGCISSVYCFYDPALAKWSLGTVAALAEILLVRATPGMQYYYLGYYIPSCPRMRYKAAFRPSMLLDPVTHEWRPADGLPGAET